MFEQFLAAAVLAVSPAIVSWATGFIKRLPPINEAHTSRKPLVRSIAAALAILYVILTAWATGGEIDPTQFGDLLLTVVTSFFMWLSTLGWYHAFKKE